MYNQGSASSDNMASGHSLKTRAEQERISSFLRENTRRSNSQEKKSRRHQGGSSRHHQRHPLDPVQSDSDSDYHSRHRSSNKSKSKHRRSYSRSSSSENDRRRKHKQHDTNQRRHRRHSSASSSHSSTTRSKSRDRKRPISDEKQEPKVTSTIVMHNIPLSFDEHELLSELSIAKVPVQEIRIIHRRDPTTNLQTAYVEFNTIQEAEQWMNLTQGTFLLNDHPVTLTHRFDDDSSSKNNNNNSNTHRDYQRNNTNELRLRDWDCYKCGVQNFKRRDHCFNCHISREDSERTRDLDGFSFVGLNPCNTLVLRGLDILTTKETIEAKLIELTLIQMKNTAIVKDNYTGVSRGFAFVEYNSIHESVLVYEKLQTTTPGVEIEGKAVIAHFSKNNFATSLAQIHDEDEDFYSKRSTRHRHRHDHDHDRSANVAQLLPSNNVDRTNTAAEIAQQALQSIHAQKQRDYTRQQRRRNHSSSDDSSDSSSNQQIKRQRSTKTSTKEPEQYTTPDPSKFEWFPDVGYHFDKTTGFYFDAKSSYFYNSNTQKYMYWDPAQSNYIPVEDTTPTAAATTVTSNDTTNATANEANEKAEKAKNAQKVAKEMELWAKKERERKEKEAKRKAQITTTSTTINAADTASNSNTIGSGASVSSTFADTGLPSVRPAGGLISLNLMSSNSGTSTVNRPTLLAAFDNPDSDDNDDSTTTLKPPTTTTATASTNILDASEEKLVDWGKLTCLLCQRQFDTREILEKHLQMSNLHKENLTKAGIVRSQPLVYRDRAKERRDKFGTDDLSKRNDHSPVHERSYSSNSSSSTAAPAAAAATATPSSSSFGSIGSKLLKKHGWQEGQGLGKKLQGRADPVEAEMRPSGVGLGADQHMRYRPQPGESYKDVVRKVARARFSMMES
ncbi:hypothetical protein I4U23_007936 [Adineta vaga]|nr:hypothetical protein I4U23_007936 [Adineta vaga]